MAADAKIQLAAAGGKKDHDLPAGSVVEEEHVYDFLPQNQLEVLDQLGSIVMLHIPRDKRLRDAVNIAQPLEIDRRYPL